MKDTILSLLKNKKRLKVDQALRQLKHAVHGSGVQCERCKKFIEAKSKYRYDHERQCKSGKQVHRISFAKVRSRYFCYHGCSYFTTRHKLVRHLLEEHRDTLSQWGILPRLLKEPIRTWVRAARLHILAMGTMSKVS